MKQEEMKFKYTTDGKKVVVIGNLNSQEKIVQEVFIVNGSEIPSGENFVVKSLHDAPAISWKEKSIKEWDEKYEIASKDHDSRMTDIKVRLRKQQELLEDKLKHVCRILKNVSEDSFNTLVDYLTGNIKYIVVSGWEPELIDFNKVDENCNYSKERMTLLSLYGNDDGTLTYALGRYTDGSGGNQIYFTAFNNYDDALEKFKELVLSKSLSEKIIEICKKYDFAIDPEKLSAYKEETIKRYTESVISTQKRIDDWNKSITDLENL